MGPKNDSVRCDLSEKGASAGDGYTVSQGETDSAATASLVGVRAPLIAGLVIVVALAGLAGWLGLRALQSRASAQQRALFLAVGKQAALNLSTIDYTQVDSDLQRVLDTSTGAFHDNFRDHSPPFAAVVKQAKSKTEGTINEAAIASMGPDGAELLVALSVKTTTAAVPQPQLRSWRMRIDIQKVADGAKVSEVQFVP